MTNSRGRQHGRRFTSSWWFAVAVVVFLLGLVPLGIRLSETVASVVSYDLHDFDSSQATNLTIEDGEQLAIFTTYQGSGTLRCNGMRVPDDADEGSSDLAPESLEHPSVDVTYTQGSLEWNRVAVTPEEWADGDYSVNCNVVSAEVGSAAPELTYATNPPILATLVGLGIAVAVAGIAAVVAIAIVIVVAIRRSNRNKPPRSPWPVFPESPPPPGQT